MDEQTKIHIDKAFDLIQHFVDNPDEIEQYPDGTEFTFKSDGDVCEECGTVSNGEVEIHADLNGTGIHKVVEIQTNNELII